MSGCPSESRLHAYHDAELDAATSDEVARHVAACQSCTHRLAELREMSDAMAGYDAGNDLTPMELARLHRSLDVAEEGSLIRFSTVLATMAASVLIISLTWIGQTPAQAPQPPLVRDNRQLPQWERLAMGETPASPVQSPADAQLPDTGVASSETINWMLNGLQNPNAHDNR